MIRVRVNGAMREYDGDTRLPLLWFLRNDIGLTGTKFGCGVGLCGACTIHLDGAATRSCLLPMATLEGRDVTTIEGLDPNGEHPLQLSWQRNNVPQCGYCQSGQIMQAASLLESNPEPSEAEIRRAMAGNLCRCGTYQRIIEAIRDAALDR